MLCFSSFRFLQDSLILRPISPLVSFSHTHPLILWAIDKLLQVSLWLRSPREACKITGVTVASGPGAAELQMSP